MTNFLRDVGEDLDRGRVYLPAAELAAFGVDRDLLAWCRTTGRTDPGSGGPWPTSSPGPAAVYRRAERGIALLHPVSRPCVRTAHVLYGGILDEIVDADYDVLRRRVAVGTGGARRWPCRAWPGGGRAVAAYVSPAPPPPPVGAQNAIVWARRLTSRSRPELRASIGGPASSRRPRTATAGSRGRRSRRRGAR